MAKHYCYAELEKKLAENNTRLATNLINENHIFISTERIENLRDGKKAMNVIATYCPFCGKKLKGTCIVDPDYQKIVKLSRETFN
jgi:hypothetical protein